MKNNIIDIENCFLIKELKLNIISYYVYNFQNKINDYTNISDINDYELNDINEIKYSNDINKSIYTIAVPTIHDVIDFIYNNYNIIISVTPRKDGWFKNIYDGCYLIIWKDNDSYIYDNCDNGNYYDMLNLGIKIVLNKIKNGEF